MASAAPSKVEPGDEETKLHLQLLRFSLRGDDGECLPRSRGWSVGGAIQVVRLIVIAYVALFIFALVGYFLTVVLPWFLKVVVPMAWP